MDQRGSVPARRVQVAFAHGGARPRRRMAPAPSRHSRPAQSLQVASRPTGVGRGRHAPPRLRRRRAGTRGGRAVNASALDRLVAATLYEGYILYPYRPSSVKNQVRWSFGGVHPRSWSEATGGTDPWTAQTECLLRAAGATTVSVRVRFLQLVTRTVAKLDPPSPALDADAIGRLEGVDELRVAGVNHRGWGEAD